MINPADILHAKILVVDDQEANVILLEQTLRGAGYTAVTSTMQPDQVCELYLLHHYDLILLDLLMPKMDGFAVMENLKTIETSGYLPVIVVTAQTDHKLRALKAGAKDFISKPFDLAEILIRVHNMLEVRLLHLETRKLYERVVAEKKVSERLFRELLLRPSLAGPLGADEVPVEARLLGCRAEVAALFLDIVEFTAFSEGADAQVMTSVLDGISSFAPESASDSASQRAQALENTYMAVVGLADPVANHSLAAAEKALELVASVARFNDHNPFQLTLRLAIGSPKLKAGKHPRHGLRRKPGTHPISMA
jgi:adenylate cyclase